MSKSQKECDGWIRVHDDASDMSMNLVIGLAALLLVAW